MHQLLRPDPYDPFDNPTQHRTYASHYRSVLPQIGLPGYQIPLSPTKQERKRIRHYFNAVGFGFFAHFFFVQIAAMLFLLLFDFLLGLSGNPIDPDTYIEQSSMLIALNGLLFLTANTGVACIGCRATKIPIRSFFRTDQFHFSDVLPYLFIGIFIQCVTGYAASWITTLLDQGGITAYEPDIDYYGTGTAIAAEILYSCLIAPITEELLYRGFALKNLSRVSQRTGILITAFLFGLGHQNIAQFVLAFPLGIFLGAITVRHNSILPAIFVHITVNTVSTIFDLGYTWITEESLLYAFDVYGNLLYLLVAIIGGVLFLLHLRKYTFPKNTPAQSMRGSRILLTSPWLLAVIAANLYVAMIAIQSASGV
ncbi:MAG: CPBP family intramembrane metalloprotease [Oscillospiraceae bacterium]|nr:CPBP family intramembrane metalloprotease [Oscillospiraceae bacterium]